MMPPLSARQADILDYCHTYAVENGWAVSVKEVQEKLGLCHHTVMYNMYKLHVKGYITFRGSRQIKVMFLP